MIKICEILDSLVFLFLKKKIKIYTYLVCTGGGQGTTCGNWFSSFTMWILETKAKPCPQAWHLVLLFNPCQSSLFVLLLLWEAPHSGSPSVIFL